MHPTEDILGIAFFTGKQEALLTSLEKGGLLTAPAAPALVDLGKNASYTEALQQSDFVITDSGLMVLLWALIKNRRIPKLSGLRLLKGLLSRESIKKDGASFWINPSESAQEKTLQYLNNQGFHLKESDLYTAPMYPTGDIKDPQLIKAINNKRPTYIFINIGGGKQEVLGLYIKKNLDYTPAIICTGAAIAFLTGEQTRIPEWADKICMGWFFRCIDKPLMFGRRYLKALKLIPLMLRFKECMPVYESP